MQEFIMYCMISVTIFGGLILLSSFFFFLPPESEGGYPFESGMDPMGEDKPPFYMHFFHISILFLIFDVELILVLPPILFPLMDPQMDSFWVSFFFLLFVGLSVELMMGTLSWKE